MPRAQTYEKRREYYIAKASEWQKQISWRANMLKNDATAEELLTLAINMLGETVG